MIDERDGRRVLNDGASRGGQVRSPESNDPYKSRVARLAVVSALIAGVLGIVFAINSMRAGDEMGSGVLLAASALAFAPIAFSAVRR